MSCPNPEIARIVIEQVGNGGTVSNLRGEVVNGRTGNLASHEMCLADAHLFGTLSWIPGGPWNLATEQAIWSADVPAGDDS